jgi:hypothetical protein
MATPRNPDNHSFDHLFSLLVEDIVLAAAPLVHAQIEPSQGSPVFLPKHAIDSWDQTSMQLEYCGFKPGSVDHWLLLGIHKLEGPSPCIEEINNRVRCGKQVAHLCCSRSHSDAAKAEAKSFIEKT